MLVAEVQTASPRLTRDTAALREVNFFSRFSIRMGMDTLAVKDPVAGKPDDCPAKFRVTSRYACESTVCGVFWKSW